MAWIPAPRAACRWLVTRGVPAGAATAVTSRETLLAPWLPAACRVTIEGAICDQWTMLHTAMKTMARAAKIKGPFERR